MKCCCCHTPLKLGLASWHFFCPACKYEHSTLAPIINETAWQDVVFEACRRTGLEELRRHNYSKMIREIKLLRPHAASEALLDVGAAHGWFIEAARGVFKEAMGIEPDKLVADATIERGVLLRVGYFPDVLTAEERFDVIVFNDVFEHIPDSALTLDAVCAHLRPEGLLVLNLPVNSGCLYRVARVFKRMGVDGTFDRMWQKDLPSPHLHYFNANNLDELLVKHGFCKEIIFDVPSIQIKGLYERIALLSGRRGVLIKRGLWLGLVAIFPVLSLLPCDTRVFIYRNALHGGSDEKTT